MELPDGVAVVWEHRHDKADPRGGMTIARLYRAPLSKDATNQDLLGIGVSICRPDENYSKPLGRTITLNRALRDKDEKGRWLKGRERLSKAYADARRT